MRLFALCAGSLAALALAAACAGDPTPRYVPLGGPDTPGTGRCPDAQDLGLVVPLWDEAEARTRLVLHEATLGLGAVGLPYLPEPAGQGARPVPLSQAQAVDLGARPTTAPVWLWTTAGEPPCQMTPGEHLLVRSAVAPDRIALVREVTGGCVAPPDGGFALAAQTMTAPRACVLGWPVEVAASSLGDDPPMGLPPEVATRLAGGRCPEPCDLRFRVVGVPTDFGGGAWEVTVAEVTPGPTGGVCDGRITEDRWLVYGPRYGAGAVLPDADELLGILGDDTGVRLVVGRRGDALQVFGVGGAEAPASLRATVPAWPMRPRPTLVTECPTTTL